MKTVNFQELMATMTAEQAKPRTKAEIIELLQTDGEAFASLLDGLDDAFLAENRHDDAGRGAAGEEPVRDAARREGTRDAPSRAIDADGAHDRHRAASDAGLSGTHGADAGGAGGTVTAPRFTPPAVAFSER